MQKTHTNLYVFRQEEVAENDENDENDENGTETVEMAASSSQSVQSESTYTLLSEPSFEQKKEYVIQHFSGVPDEAVDELYNRLPPLSSAPTSETTTTTGDNPYLDKDLMKGFEDFSPRKNKNFQKKYDHKR